MTTSFPLTEIDCEDHFRQVEKKAVRDAMRLCADRGHGGVPCLECMAETLRPRMTTAAAREVVTRLYPKTPDAASAILPRC